MSNMSGVEGGTAEVVEVLGVVKVAADVAIRLVCVVVGARRSVEVNGVEPLVLEVLEGVW